MEHKKVDELVKTIFPKVLVLWIREKVRYVRLANTYLYDLNHYYDHSMSSNRESEKSKAISKIILDTHVIEKGLTMPNTKFGFGVARLEVLIKNIINYILIYGKDDPQLLHGISVVNEYFSFHNDNQFQLDKKLLLKHQSFNETIASHNVVFESRNQIVSTKESYFEHVHSAFFDFASSRSSVRNFSTELVDENLILNSLDLSRNTPSACNRQSVRVHLYQNKEEIIKILEKQGGNRGFGHLANSLLIVTFEPSVYFEESERVSGYVDGGMYCMNILYALHANGIAGCILNAAHNKTKDLAIRKVTKIPKSECFVAMIACGLPPDNFKIAKSFRYGLDYILTKH